MLKRISKAYRAHGLYGIADAGIKKLLKPPETFREPEEEYIAWLRAAIPGWLDSGNVEAFRYVLAHLPSTAPILEIGCFAGLSTNVLTYLKAKAGVPNRLISCDPWLFEGAEGGGMLAASSVPTAVYREFVKDTFKRGISAFSENDKPHALEMSSDDFFQAWESGKPSTDLFGQQLKLGGLVSLVYIDGNHTYEFARRDFLNASRFLEVGGFILLDDSADGTKWGSHQVALEMAANPSYQLVSKRPHYLFRKLHRTINLPTGV